MNQSPLFLVLDQGGSASRALVFDDEGREQASSRVDVADHRPQPGWVEQDPEEVVASLLQAANSAVQQLDDARRRLQACGLSCQRSSLVCWDRTSGSALSPILSWQDTRAADWLAGQRLDFEALRATTGLVPNAHYGLSKIRWCMDNLDEVKRAAGDGRLAVGPLASFLAFHLLEQNPLLVDPANASRTLLLDLVRGDWSDAWLDRFGIDRRWLPNITRTDAEYGTMALPSARLPMRLLSGDQSTAAFAHGEPRPEAAYLNVGTGAFVYRLAFGQAAPAGLLRSVVHWSEVPEYANEGTVNGAGSALAWFAKQHGIVDVAGGLEKHWADSAADLLFLNGIGGLGSPDWRPEFQSRFIGDGSTGQKLVAVAESIVFLIQRNLSLLADGGEQCTHVMASGGISNSDHLCQALGDLSSLPVRRPAQCEASARGAAFLLAGRPASWVQLPEQRFEPQPNAALHARYRRWSEAMDAALLS